MAGYNFTHKDSNLIINCSIREKAFEGRYSGDFFLFNKQDSNNNVIFGIGDVVGHGKPAYETKQEIIKKLTRLLIWRTLSKELITIS